MMMASNTGEHGMCTVKRYLDIKVSHNGKELPKFFHITLCPLKDTNIDFKKYSVFLQFPLMLPKLFDYVQQHILNYLTQK